MGNYNETPTVIRFFPNLQREGEHIVEFGEATEERKKLYDEIFLQYFGPLSMAHPETSSQAILLMGGPASGKSTIRKAIPDLQTFIVLDSDDVKEKLPEYHDLIEQGNTDASAIVHEESSYITRELRDYAVDNRYNILFDGVGSNIRSYSALVKTLLEGGYRVRIIMVDAGLEIALMRSRMRKRRVPFSVLQYAYCCDRVRGNAKQLLMQYNVDGAVVNSYARPAAIIWDRTSGIDTANDLEYAQLFWEGHCPDKFRVEIEEQTREMGAKT
ncbi:MAG TPA: zeta toxin family protein [Candidatus Kapabacteria bacterium]|nr:zeta toxin family protein [Candidatus Kapabacteria bacterium]